MPSSSFRTPPATLSVRDRPCDRGVALEIRERGRMAQNIAVTLVIAPVPWLGIVAKWRGGSVPWAVVAGALVVLAWLIAIGWQRDRVALDGDRLRCGWWQLSTDAVVGFEVVDHAALSAPSWTVIVVASDRRRHRLFSFSRADHARWLADRLSVALAELRPAGYRSDGRRAAVTD